MKTITRMCILLVLLCASIFTLCSCGENSAPQQTAQSSHVSSAPPSESSSESSLDSKGNSPAGNTGNSNSSKPQDGKEDTQEYEQKLDLSDDNALEMPLGLPSTVKHSDKSKFTEAEWNEILKKIETGEIVWEDCEDLR